MKHLSSRLANYDIDVVFDDQNKTLKADQIIRWTNSSSDTILTLQFHLYYNAFKNDQSTFFNGSSRANFLKAAVSGDDCHWGYSEITSIKVDSEKELIAQLRYIQPDDGNKNDQTVAELILEKGVLPGKSIQVKLKWNSKIPKTKVRTGYNKDFYHFAQWFPKLGRYEPAHKCNNNNGQWKCHQYHASGEYYADFGNYNVSITAPSEFVLGASGSLIKKIEKPEYNVWTYQLNDVIDFAWTASPHFSVQKEKWEQVELSLLTYPGHEHCGKRYFKAVKNALEYLNKHVGEYPYKTLTIIDPPIHGIFTGGMEYPTLITSLSFCFLPEGVMTTETLTVHEFVHQYFMQMIATNEQEEPWMDEGITTYYEGRIMDHYYGQHESTIKWLGMTVGNEEYNRWEFFNVDNPKIADNTRKSREFIHGGYSTISYNKTAVWLKTLEGLVGIETMDLIMKSYFDRWKYKHPCASDFEDVVTEVLIGENSDKAFADMSWFFDQVLRGTDICDYKVASIFNDEIYPGSGFLQNTDDCITADKTSATPNIKSSVILHRLGEVKLPVEVEIHFDDGSKKMEYWDGMDRSHSYEYIGKFKIVSAIIDPNKYIYIDQNFINNSLQIEANRTGIKYYMTHFLEKVQNVMLGMSTFI